MGEEIAGLVVTFACLILSAVFVALQQYFASIDDSPMVTLMCGMVMLCGGTTAGWWLFGKRKGGE